VSVLYVPLVQNEHADKPPAALYVPVGQYEQNDKPWPVLYCPATQSGHVEAVMAVPVL
jgi:hypothetical protein